MPEIEIDPELLADFIVESRDLLQEYTANLIELEKKPDDPEVISAVFRAAHTLKGSSAFFNLTNIKNFAHKLENLLDEVRNKTRQVTSEVIDLLLTGGNHLKSMFHRISSGDYSVQYTDTENQFLKVLLEYLEKRPAPVRSAQEVLEAIKVISDQFKKNIHGAEQSLVEIDKLLVDFGLTATSSETKVGQEPDMPPPAAATRPVTSYRFQGIDFTTPLQTAVNLMDLATTSARLDEAAYDQALKTLEQLVEANSLEPLREPLVGAAEDFRAVKDSGMDFDPLLISFVKSKLDAVVALMEVKVESVIAAPPAATVPSLSAPATTGPTKPTPERHERKTMRIDEEKVDGFMNYVGELIVTSETFNYLQKMIEHEKVNPQTVRAFKNANQAFRELSDELQEGLMEIRKVPINHLLQKVNMMARELSHQMKKKIRVEIEGAEIQVDKSIAERLEGPLVHVVRNSLDHGLELPADREAVGKPAEGTLKVSASADKEFFYLIVADDGKGVNPEIIKKAAVDKGLLTSTQAANLTDKEAVNLIFAPGFSTAKEITDISGRGVGMDVVRTNITQLNGTINVDSVTGRGTTISLKIPVSVTLQVVKALLVRVGRENYIISLDVIVESLRPAPEDLTTMQGRGEVILRRGQIFPLIRLYEIFNVTPEFTDPSQAILVVVQTPQGRYGFMVDQVIGQQQVVVKELGPQFKKLSFIAGSATLGDGSLGLVLDGEGVIDLALGRT